MLFLGDHRRVIKRDCDCQNPFKAQCIRILADKSGMFQKPHEIDRCKDSKSQDISKSEFNLNALFSTCTHLNIKGTISTCVSIQTYHQVKMTFHKMKNDNIQNCILGKNFITEESISKGISIYVTNQTRYVYYTVGQLICYCYM